MGNLAIGERWHMQEGGGRWVLKHLCLLITVCILCLGIGLFLSRMLPRRNTGTLVLQTDETVIAEREEAEATAGRLNLNTASAAELASLPGIGQELARRIVAYRRTNGRFRYPYELMNIPGIDEKTYEALRDRITAG